jgi:RimJ/RimL family protein N-acetyltransferase
MDEPWTVDDALAYGHSLLRGERVTLRAAREEDFAQLAGWWVDPELAVFQTNFVRPTPGVTISDLMRGWCANVGSDVGFTVVQDGTTDTSGGSERSGAHEAAVIGMINLYGVTKNRSATFGIVLGRDHWGQGLGTEATRLAVAYGFREMGLHRIELGVYAYNQRALATYTRAGFRQEGRRREAIFHDGGWHDEILMAQLEHEWRHPGSSD